MTIIEIVERFSGIALRFLSGDEFWNPHQLYEEWRPLLSLDDSTPESTEEILVLLDNVLRALLKPKQLSRPSTPATVKEDPEQKLRVAREIQRIRNAVPTITTPQPLQVFFPAFDPRPRKSAVDPPPPDKPKSRKNEHTKSGTDDNKNTSSSELQGSRILDASTAHDIVHSLSEVSFQDRKYLLECAKNPKGLHAEELKGYEPRPMSVNGLTPKYPGSKYGVSWDGSLHGISLRSGGSDHSRPQTAMGIRKSGNSSPQKSKTSSSRDVGGAVPHSSFAQHVKHIRQSKRSLPNEVVENMMSETRIEDLRTGVAVTVCATSYL
eukprot:PhF_6_TR18919/c0_g1_i1/m.27642